MSLKTEILDRAAELLLTDKDIYEACNKEVNIYTVDMLEDYTTLEEALDLNNHGRAIIYYKGENNPAIGHWIAITKRGRVISIFDPYGMSTGELSQLAGYPTDIIAEMATNYKVEQNSKRVQKVDDDVNTCGRHCIMRVLFDMMNNDTYIKFMSDVDKSLRNIDDVVVIMTLFHDLQKNRFI